MYEDKCMSAFTIAQISDIHITLKKGKAIDGIDVIANFRNLLVDIVKASPDLLVLSGDLCFSRNDKKVYSFVKEKLDATGLDYIVMSGNHDKSSALAEAFGYTLVGKDLTVQRDISGYRLIFADSSRHKVSSSQLDIISRALKTDLKPVLFIHHPPAIAGVPFMDRKYPLMNMRDLQEVLGRYKGDIPVFCGHYHNERVFTHGNLKIHIVPSTYFQISESSEHFSVSRGLPGWRLITLSDTIKTEVRYLKKK